MSPFVWRNPPKSPPKPRKSRAKPTEGFTGTEVVRLTHVSKRTLQNWVVWGFIPSPVFRGRGTRYTRAEVARILVVKQLRADFVPNANMKQRLAKMTDAEIEARSGIAALLGETTPPASTVSVATSGTPVAELPPWTERWDRVALAPGLELGVRDEPVARALAREIVAAFHARRAAG